jgi:hypothetical protein
LDKCDKTTIKEIRAKISKMPDRCRKLIEIGDKAIQVISTVNISYIEISEMMREFGVMRVKKVYPGMLTRVTYSGLSNGFN